jgi:hypothetical protein
MLTPERLPSTATARIASTVAARNVSLSRKAMLTLHRAAQRHLQSDEYEAPRCCIKRPSFAGQSSHALFASHQQHSARACAYISCRVQVLVLVPIPRRISNVAALSGLSTLMDALHSTHITGWSVVNQRRIACSPGFFNLRAHLWLHVSRLLRIFVHLLVSSPTKTRCRITTYY